MKVFRGKIITPFKVINRGQVEIKGSKIIFVGPTKESGGQIFDYGDSIITPGLIDIHIHGLLGNDVMDPDFSRIYEISRALASKGVTGFLATLQTSPYNEIVDALTRVKTAMSERKSGAKILGIHIEGPYICDKRKGAQREYLRQPVIDEIQELTCAADGSLALVTLAPEIPGAIEAIKFLKEHNIIVSSGHTDATFEEAKKAFDIGVTLLGHFWNGMREIHHREPGIVGAGLLDDRVAAELIADCHHVHPSILDLTVRLKGVQNIILVSDSIKPAGLPDGDYIIDGLEYSIRKGLIKLASGVIAGSSLSLNMAVKNMVEIVGINVTDALQMATFNPARVIGVASKGKLKPGYDADLAVFDSEFNVLETVVEGTTVFKKG